MAPNRKFRTYGRGHNNSSLSCMEAFNILFAKNLTQRKLEKRTFKGKNKLKVDIKELPAKIKTVLIDEEDTSLRVNINDTFDLLKNPCTNLRPNNASVKIIKDNSCSVIKSLSHLSNVSPMLSKLRSYSNKSLTKNKTNSWFNHSTLPGEGISNTLEIEKIGSSWKKIDKSKKLSESDRKSPILLRSTSQKIAQTNKHSLNLSKCSIEITNLSKENNTHSNTNFILNNGFTNSLGEQILFHSSTPVAPYKKKCFIKQQGVSPIKIQDEVKNCIVESLEEIESWNSSLPQLEPQNSEKTEKPQTEPLQTSYYLEDFELFFEQLKAESINVEDKSKTKSISLDDFETFHKKFINSQPRNGEKSKGISLKDFETFCESYYDKKISFDGDSFFDNCQKSFNFVTHRKHKFSLVPKRTSHTRLSTKFNLKDLRVVLDNKIVNYSNLSQVYSQRNKTNERQLTVKLTRISLDKLKLSVNRRESYFKAKSKHSINNNNYKACRKFCSNWDMQNSRFSPNNSIDMSSNNALSDLTDKTGIKSIIAKSIGDSFSQTPLRSRRCTNQNYDKSEKENELLCIDFSGAENTKSYPIRSSSFRGSRRALLRFNGRKSETDLHYLRTSSIENSQEIVDQQLLLPSSLCESANIPKPDTEKQYVAKILTISTSDSSNELQEKDSYAFRLANKHPHDIYPNNYSNKKDNRQTQANFTKSDTQISYIAQDLSDSVLLKINTSPRSDSSPLPLRSSSTYSQKSFSRNSPKPSTICLRSSSTKKNLDDNEHYPINSPLSSSIVSVNSEASDQIQDFLFKSPLMVHFRKKPPNLKAGKSWRRSLMQHKKEISNDLTRNSPCGIIGKQEENLRLSAKILPLEETNRLRRKTTLQAYVYSDQIVTNENITKSFRNSSVGEPKPLITARDLVLEYCAQTDPVPFEELYSNSLLKNCKKIGEGVYGEVFLCTQADGSSTVMKVIPIEGNKLINGERQKKFHEILSEVAIVSQLSNLRNSFHNKTSAFCEVQRISCVRGRYPKILLDRWRAYDEAKGSENDPPDVFEKDQLYIVLDLAHAGQDLEAFVFNNAVQAVAMFKQVAYALAVGEEHVQFEHRDLHWGNILLRAVEKRKEIIFKHKGKVKECLSEGVEVTIIDFTLSRIAHDGVVIFNDLGQDPELFLAEGDYQFDIYRLMKERNNNDWRKFTPYTNILWLHYVVKKSVTALRYKNSKSKIHKNAIDSLKKYEKVILNFDSVSEFVEECL